MHYEINVSKDGIHFFATHERSITSESKLQQLVDIFKEKFPETEGYEISATLYRTTGTGIKLD